MPRLTWRGRPGSLNGLVSHVVLEAVRASSDRKRFHLASDRRHNCASLRWPWVACDFHSWPWVASAIFHPRFFACCLILSKSSPRGTQALLIPMVASPDSEDRLPHLVESLISGFEELRSIVRIQFDSEKALREKIEFAANEVSDESCSAHTYRFIL